MGNPAGDRLKKRVKRRKKFEARMEGMAYVSKETGLLKEWPKEGPPRVWLNGDVGLGYAGVAIANGKLFTMGAREETEFLICLDANDGKEVWAAQIGSRLGNGWGDGPRGTPSVDGDKVFAMGGQGALICAQVASGEIVWTKSMSSLGGKKPGWGFCESVTVDGPRVLCTPGGSEGEWLNLAWFFGPTRFAEL